MSTREGARLQGFPDNFIFYGSKTSKNLQIGNAVPPMFGEIIGKQIKKSLKMMFNKNIGWQFDNTYSIIAHFNY